MSDKQTIEIVGAFESLTPEYLQVGDGGEVLVEGGQWIVTAIADERPELGHHEIGGGNSPDWSPKLPTVPGWYWVRPLKYRALDRMHVYELRAATRTDCQRWHQCGIIIFSQEFAPGSEFAPMPDPPEASP